MESVQSDAPPGAGSDDWLWRGYLKPGDITLLTSLWKTGKTTLLAGILRSLGSGMAFLDRPTRPARAWVVSEESQSQWRERLARMPIGPHVQLIARPFQGRPTPADWDDLIGRALAAKIDLLVVVRWRRSFRGGANRMPPACSKRFSPFTGSRGRDGRAAPSPSAEAGFRSRQFGARLGGDARLRRYFAGVDPPQPI